MWTHIPTLGSIHQVTTCMHPPFPTNRVSEIKLYIWNNSHSHVHKISCVTWWSAECIAIYILNVLMVIKWAWAVMNLFSYSLFNWYDIIYQIWRYDQGGVWSGSRSATRDTLHLFETPTWQLTQKQSIVLTQCDVTCKDVFTITLSI